MNHKYVLMVLRTDCEPPTGRRLHENTDGSRFAPLSHQGPLFTIDCDLWHAVADRTRVCSAQRVLCPGASEYQRLLIDADMTGDLVIVAVTEYPDFQPLGWNERQKLLEFSEGTSADSSDFVDLGFDVIDFSGLSGLFNVGYSPDNMAALCAEHEIISNAYGLISDADGADRFVKFATENAPEHAPFIAVRILALKATISC